jgi:formate/nitrite transporter FocA (FNT family)
LRFGASVVVSKYFDNFVGYIQQKTSLSRKWSIAVVVFLANVLGTFTAMGLGVSLASAAAGVPIFPPKA